MRQPDHDYHETTRDRDDRLIDPTCTYCGKPKDLCDEGAKQPANLEISGIHGTNVRSTTMQMKIYDNPDVTGFIPGRGRILIVPRGEEPSLGEIILVYFDGNPIQKRVVGLEFGTSNKTVGVVIRELDFPDPNFWAV